MKTYNVEKMVRMFKKGATVNLIAFNEGTSPDNVRKILRKNGIDFKRKGVDDK